MPDFPNEPRPGSLFYTNMTEWTRRTGLLPDFTSATFSMSVGGVMCPVRIPRSMVVEKLYVANGASVSGSHQMALFDSYESYDHSLSPIIYPGFSVSAITSQAGTSVWQALPVVGAPRRVAPGLYYLAYVASASAGTVQRLFNSLAANSGQLAAGGIIHTVAYPLPPLLWAMGSIPSYVVPCLAVGGVP